MPGVTFFEVLQAVTLGLVGTLVVFGVLATVIGACVEVPFEE